MNLNLKMLGQASTSKYHEYLKSKIHNSKDKLIQPNYASVTLEFEYTNLGEKNNFLVKRLWEVNGSNVSEILTIEKNGQCIDDIERENWQAFIKEMIPDGLSQLFFFDGEKIQKIMFDESNSELKKSIKTLIGLDLVERLNADLKIYRSKLLKEMADNNFVQELEQCEEEVKIIEVQICKIKDDRANLENSIARLQSKIVTYKDKISAQGEGYYKNKANLEVEKNALEKDIELIKEKIREIAAGLLPVSIASSCAFKLKNQVENENTYQANILLSKELENRCKQILCIVDGDNFLQSIDIKKKSLTDVKSRIKSEISKLFEDENSLNMEVEEVFGFSQKQTIEILQLMDKALKTLPLELIDLTKGYEMKYRKLQDITTQLQRVPEGELIQPMYETLEKLNNEIGGMTVKRDHYDTTLGVLNNNKTELLRRTDSLNKKLETRNKTDEKLQTISKVESVLSRYYRELSKSKIYHLQEELANIFNLLNQKEDMISRIEISPETFDVCLYDINDKKINKKSLSSGELEIYSMSMLWALAKTSGQKLPFIVDTPLARLDSNHRDKLVELFFPHASHQMIIFSTNTEVDSQYFDCLQPFISMAYNLEYNDQSKKTVVKKGYFWN